MTKVGSEKIEREKGYLFYVAGDGFVWKVPMRSNKSGKKQRVGNEKIVREPGYLYYLGKSGYVEKAKR